MVTALSSKAQGVPEKANIDRRCYRNWGCAMLSKLRFFLQNKIETISLKNSSERKKRMLVMFYMGKRRPKYLTFWP